MKIYLSITAIIVYAFLFSSCRSNQKRSEEMADFKQTIIQDSTLNVKLLAVEGDSIRIQNLADGRVRVMDYVTTRNANQIKGDLNVGDTLDVMPDFDNRSCLQIVNISQMLGLWFFNNNQEGIRLSASGSCAGVNVQDVNFKSWRVKNGDFLVTYRDCSDPANPSAEIEDTSAIEKLNKDTLTISFRGKQMVCRRVVGLLEVHRK